MSGFSFFCFAVLGDVAQLGERRLCKPEVVGSSPIVSIFLSYKVFGFLALLNSTPKLYLFFDKSIYEYAVKFF